MANQNNRNSGSNKNHGQNRPQNQNQNQTIAAETVDESTGSTAASNQPKAGSEQLVAAVTEAAVTGLTRTFEDSAMRLVDTVEEKTMAAVASAEDRFGAYEAKAHEKVNQYMDRAVEALDHIDELPGLVDKKVRSHPMWAAGIGLGVGIAIKLAQHFVPEGTVSGYAKESASALAKTAASRINELLADTKSVGQPVGQA